MIATSWQSLKIILLGRIHFLTGGRQGNVLVDHIAEDGFFIV